MNYSFHGDSADIQWIVIRFRVSYEELNHQKEFAFKRANIPNVLINQWISRGRLLSWIIWNIIGQRRHMTLDEELQLRNAVSLTIEQVQWQGENERNARTILNLKAMSSSTFLLLWTQAMCTSIQFIPYAVVVREMVDMHNL